MFSKLLIAVILPSLALAIPASDPTTSLSSTTDPITSTSVASTTSAPSTSTAASTTVAPAPSLTPVQIHPIANSAKCLDVRGAALANGTAVQIFDCNGSNAQNWLINRNDTKVQLAGTEFCLDAGTTPANNVVMKIWTCFDNLPAQAWFYTADSRIAVTGKGQCLDLTNGNVANSNPVQTFLCTDGNSNQIWTTS